ncbi:MAG: ABC transporter permease [Planctomycetes bacterium]|nr:ABC transporter permease [Planctomycetota bacterium]
MPVVAKTAGMPSSAHEVWIEPPRAWAGANWKQLWRHRALLWTLTWRDIKVRYRQTVLGAIWAVLQPLTTMAIFTVVFGRLAQMSSDGVPYPIFVFMGLLPWLFVSQGLNVASNSLVGNAGLITKVYFPRLIIPTASILSSLVDFGISFGVLVCLMAWYGLVPSLSWLLLPMPLALAVVTSLGVGIWLSALNVKFRDVRLTIPFLTQIWMFSSPIIFPTSLIEPKWRTLYGLNPMVGIIEGFRWSLIPRGVAPDLGSIVMSTVVALVLLATGVLFFRRVERNFADLI